MGKFIKNTLAYLLALLLCLPITGCGSNEGQILPENQENQGVGGYIAEEFALPHESIMNETVHQNTLYYVNYTLDESTGSIAAQTLYQAELNQEPVTPTPIPCELAEDKDIMAMCVDKEGKLHILSGKFAEADMTGGIAEMLWIRQDEAGSLTEVLSVTDFFNEHQIPYPSGFQVDAEGNGYIGIEDTIYVLSRDGNLLFSVTCQGSIYKLCQNKAGKIYVIWMSPQGEQQLAAVNNKARTVGTGQYLGGLGGMVIGAGAGVEENLLLASETGVFDYHEGKKIWQEKFNWAAVDMAVDFNGSFLPLADGRILYIGKEYQTSAVKSNPMIIRPRREGDPVPEDKVILTFGGLAQDMDDFFKQAVIDFNRNSSDYHVEIINYGAEDYRDGMTQLNAAIASGNTPDILLIPQLSGDIYTEKKVLADLYAYIDNDETMAQADFQENILKAYETEGKLYGIPLFYSIDLLVGKTALIGGRNTWTLEEMMAFADRFPESEIFNDASKSAVLRLCFKANMEHFISQDDNGAEFNQQLFLKVLEFSNRFVSDEKYVFNHNLAQRIEGGQLLLLNSLLSNFTTYQMNRAQFGEAVTYIGYPSESGSGIMVTSDSVIGVGAASPHQEGAWQFVSRMLSEEFHDEFAATAYKGFSIRKSGMAKQIEQAKAATYITDEKGNQVEQPTGVMSMGDIRIDIYAAKDEEIQGFTELIESADGVYNTETQVMDIVKEEAGAFFGGEKSAAEVADIIANRVQIYIKETE